MPQKWYNVYRNNDEKCVFVGKDGNSGLIRAKDKDGKKFEWRSTDALARESGLSKKRVEEILEHYCNKSVVRQHSKDPEKWGYWELVGEEKADPNVVVKDHEHRMEKQLANNGKVPTKPTKLPSHPNTGVAPPTVSPKQPKCPITPSKIIADSSVIMFFKDKITFCGIPSGQQAFFAHGSM